MISQIASPQIRVTTGFELAGEKLSWLANSDEHFIYRPATPGNQIMGVTNHWHAKLVRGCGLKGERYKKETVYVQAEQSLFLEYLAHRGPGLPFRLAGPCGGAGTRQPEVLGEDP